MAKPKKPEDEKRKNVTVTLSPEVLDRVEKLAEFIELPRSKVFENLLIVALDMIEDMEKFKLITIGKWIKKGSKRLRESFQTTAREMEKESAASGKE